MRGLTEIINSRGMNRHRLYHCPRCGKDWTPLHRTYWKVADTIADELVNQERDGVMLCNVCEFGVETRGDVRQVLVS